MATVLRGLTTISHLPTITAYFQKRQSAARPQHGSQQLSLHLLSYKKAPWNTWFGWSSRVTVTTSLNTGLRTNGFLFDINNHELPLNGAQSHLQWAGSSLLSSALAFPGWYSSGQPSILMTWSIDTHWLHSQHLPHAHSLSFSLLYASLFTFTSFRVPIFFLFFYYYLYK